VPVALQALHDAQPAVSCDALRCWAAVCHHLPKRSLLKAARQVVHLLTHPSAAVRHSAVAFIAAVARALPPADVYAQLAVMVAGSLQQQPLVLTGEEGRRGMCTVDC
jgi:ADP-ribosylglycohydrolase